VKGVTSVEDVEAGLTQIIAPAGFMEEAASENIYAGNAMGRRAMYQYGVMLPSGPTGGVDAGLGKATSLGTSTLIAPTLLVQETGERHTVDGIELEFFMAPGTEAPAEFMIWFPQFNALDSAEDVTHTLHNLYTLRGAQVRDSHAWWKDINDVIQRYGADIEVVFAQHHWPTWGNDRVVELLENQRDLYKYLHDQVLHLANNGATMLEIAEQIELPDAIGKQWANRGYYGSVSHDAKAIYQRYLGWYDSNPAHLHQLPPEQAAVKYVEFMGGAEAVLEKARASFDAGEYRWVAEVVNHVVFADPGNRDARELCAQALEQLGFQCENPTWRNEYLLGAYELRNGTPDIHLGIAASHDAVTAMTPELLLDYAGIRLDGPTAATVRSTIRWELPETGAEYLLELRNGVLIYTTGKAGKANATVTATKEALAGVITGSQPLDEALATATITIAGDTGTVTELFGLMRPFEEIFTIVEP
jgi:alkyl sulfatase BDS1-like metallo-beta-lactamase superfamily hydrolase